MAKKSSAKKKSSEVQSKPSAPRRRRLYELPDEDQQQDQEPQQSQAAPSPAAPSSSTATAQHRNAKVQLVLKNHVIMAGGAATVPVPLVDLIAVSGIQMNMLKELCKLYQKEYSENAAKTTLISLVSGVSSGILAVNVLGSFSKLIPMVGIIGAYATMPAITSALTYAVGRVFIRHFEGGGTILDFDPKSVGGYFRSQIDEARSFASGEKIS